MSETSIGSAPTGGGTHGGGLAEQGSEMKDQLKEKGRTQFRDQIDERTSQAGGQVRSFADALRRTGSDMESQSGSEQATRIASGAADRLERVGGYLEGASGDDLLRDAERFARERPWLIAGAAAAVGFTISRLLKASSESRYDGNGGQSLRGPSWTPSEDVTRTGSESDWVEPMTVASGSRR